MLHHVQNSFNAGELSSYTSARPELEVYQAGCKSMKNFIALPYGGARYRPGTELITSTKNAGPACLFGFEFSTNERHIIEFGAGYIRFFATGLDTAAPIMDGASPLEKTTPYSLNDLRELQFAQLNDIVIITHANHPPYRLSRYAVDNWVMEPFPFIAPPFLDVEVDPTLAITSSATTGTGVTLTTGADVFNALHVGAVFELAYRRTKDEITQALDIAAGTASVTVKNGRLGTTSSRTSLNISDPLRVSGAFLLQTFGIWTATVEVFRRYLGETHWEEYLTFEASDDRNINEAYTLDEPAELLVVTSSFDSSTSGRVLLSVTDPFIRGRVEIKSYVNAQQVTADVLVPLAPGAATEWSESAFSGYRGYPRAVTFHGQRLWFGGTISRPQTLWASRIDSYDDFFRPFGTDGLADADAPLALPVFSEEHNRIEWISSNRSLLAGTSAGEFVITGETREESVSANDYNIRRHTSNGSESYQALPVDSAVLFVQRQGRRIRKMGYRFEDDAYAADDVTIYNEHLTRGNLVELAFQRQREPIIWGVTNDGKLIGWTYRAAQPFFAAYEIQSPGVTYESVAVVYGEGDEDELWVVVNRASGRVIERFRPNQILAQERGEMEKLWFLDSAVEFTGATAVCTGLAHLEGLEVQIFADDSFAGRATVTGGAINNPRPLAQRTLVGIHYGGELETMPIEVGTENGSSQGRMKKAGRSVIRLFQSLTGEWFTSQNPQAHPLQSLGPQDSLTEARPLSDFDRVLESHTGATRALTIGVRQTHPYPMTILSISARITLTEDA